MKALITGICGFSGSHLAELLTKGGEEVCGTVFPGESLDNLKTLGRQPTLVAVDVADRRGVEEVVDDLRPDVIYHLAAMSSVGQTWKMADEALRVNALGLVNLILAGQKNGRPAILVVGSGEMYGQVDENKQPITEEVPLEPVNPYALSKLWQEEAAMFFTKVDDYPLFITRPFNHTGPRQSPTFVCSDFARQMASIEAEETEPVIKVGNLSASRDFLDVRDVVHAYHMTVTRGRQGEPYNIASGNPFSIREILDMLLESCLVDVRVVVEKERFRPVDISLLSGDSTRLREQTGWVPRYDLRETLKDLLDFWRQTPKGRRITR